MKKFALIALFALCVAPAFAQQQGAPTKSSSVNVNLTVSPWVKIIPAEQTFDITLGGDSVPYINGVASVIKNFNFSYGSNISTSITTAVANFGDFSCVVNSITLDGTLTEADNVLVEPGSGSGIVNFTVSADLTDGTTEEETPVEGTITITIGA